MKLLTTRTVTPSPRRLFEGSQVSPCFLDRAQRGSWAQGSLDSSQDFRAGAALAATLPS